MLMGNKKLDGYYSRRVFYYMPDNLVLF